MSWKGLGEVGTPQLRAVSQLIAALECGYWEVSSELLRGTEVGRRGVFLAWVMGRLSGEVENTGYQSQPDLGPPPSVENLIKWLYLEE